MKHSINSNFFRIVIILSALLSLLVHAFSFSNALNNPVELSKSVMGAVLFAFIIYCVLAGKSPLKQLIVLWGALIMLGSVISITKLIASDIEFGSLDWYVEVIVESFFMLLGGVLVFIAVKKVVVENKS